MHKLQYYRIMKTRHNFVKSAAIGLLSILATCFSVTEINAQVTIGSDKAPLGGSVLDLKEFDPRTNESTSDRGMLYPRVYLTDKNELYPMFQGDADYTADPTALKKSHIGLTVFNVNSSTNSFTKGIHVWDGTEWRKMDNSPVIAPAVDNMMWASASISPSIYTAGQPYDGILRIPYIGGNGAVYPSTPTVPGSASTNNLAIERIAGTLSYGGGEIFYRIHGTPTVSSPATTTFPITFYNQTGNAVVGSGISSVNLKNLTKNVTIDTSYPSSYDGSTAKKLPFEEITITESGSYAFSLRLYGHIAITTGSGGTGNGRMPFYIYLQKVETNAGGVETRTLIDAAELDVFTGTATDYSYSVTLGGVFDVGDNVIISMHRSANFGDNWYGATWLLKMGGTEQDPSPKSPVRTSLIYWKL